MNKKGQKSMSGGMLLVIAAVVIIAVVYFGNQGTGTGSVQQPQVNGDGQCYIAPANPATVATGVDALVANQNVTPANFGFIVNGIYKGSTYTNPSRNEQIVALADPTGNYLADVQTVTAVCGNYPLPFKFKAYTNATITAYTDTGITSLTNAGGANNESAWTAGQTKVNKIRLVGAGQKSTGKIFTVVEYQSNSAPNISNTGVQLSCGGQALQQVSIPSAVSSTNTNALRIGYEIPALENGAVTDCYLSSQATASKVLGTGYIRINFYAEQKFIDSDATVKEGIYDLNSNSKYQDSYTFVIGVT